MPQRHLVGSAVFAGFSRVTNTKTDKQTTPLEDVRIGIVRI